MTDILQLSNQIFGNSCIILCEETLYDFLIEYRIAASDLPSSERLTDLCNKCSERDDIEIQFRSVEKFIFEGTEDLVKSRIYENYREQLEQDDSVDVAIKIKKKFIDETISVYSIEKFSEFLRGQKFEENLQLFVELFAGGRRHICFQTLNSDSCIHTNSIAFASEFESVIWDNTKNRDSAIRNCNDSSVFLRRAQYPLVPQDFTFIESMCGNRFNEIKELFDKLRNILSYLYIANTSDIVGDKAVLQFDPTVNGYEYELEKLSRNRYIWDIYNWIYKDEGSIDRAGIVRNIINIHCKTPNEILDIDMNIYKSAVANYVIYQKKHTEQYIELKNNLSEFIVESAGQLQELAHDLVEGFRNNFVAVIVFLMTVLLTDSIDFSNFTQTSISSNIVAVCGIFTLVSLLYMIVTVIAGNMKWGWLEKSYGNLKNNYNEVLDEHDIQIAVSNDAAFKDTEKEYKKIRFIISIIWIVSIVGMTIFTFVIGYNSRCGETPTAKTYQSDNAAINPSETEALEIETNTNTEENRTDLPSIIEKETQENSL